MPLIISLGPGTPGSSCGFQGIDGEGVFVESGGGVCVEGSGGARRFGYWGLFFEGSGVGMATVL